MEKRTYVQMCGNALLNKGSAVRSITHHRFGSGIELRHPLQKWLLITIIVTSINKSVGMCGQENRCYSLKETRYQHFSCEQSSFPLQFVKCLWWTDRNAPEWKCFTLTYNRNKETFSLFLLSYYFRDPFIYFWERDRDHLYWFLTVVTKRILNPCRSTSLISYYQYIFSSVHWSGIHNYHGWLRYAFSLILHFLSDVLLFEPHYNWTDHWTFWENAICGPKSVATKTYIFVYVYCTWQDFSLSSLQ